MDDKKIYEIDTKGYLNDEINKKNDEPIRSFKTQINKIDVNLNLLFGLDANQTRLLINPESAIRKVYIYLDSRFRSKVNDDRTIFTWNFQNNNNISDGSVNAIGPIKNIVSLKIFDFFLNLYDPNYWNNQMLITVFIHEFQAQSFIAPENKNFHFAGKIWSLNGIVSPPNYQISFKKKSDVTGSSQNTYITADGNDGVFDFQDPINIIDTLSLSFGSPYTFIKMPQDTFNFIIPDILIARKIQTTVPHNIPFNNNDRVYILSFITDRPVQDADLINKMLNPPFGYPYIGRVINSNTIILDSPNNITDVPFTNMLFGNIISAIVFVDYYRFYVPIEISYKTELNEL